MFASWCLIWEGLGMTVGKGIISSSSPRSADTDVVLLYSHHLVIFTAVNTT